MSPIKSRRRWAVVLLLALGATVAFVLLGLAVLIGTEPPRPLLLSRGTAPASGAEQAAELDHPAPLSTARELVESARWRATGLLELAGISAGLLGLPRTCVEVRCLDPSGSPVTDVRVRATVRGFSLSAESGDDGWASICTRVLALPEVVEVRAVAGDLSFWKARTTLAPGETANFGEVRLQPGAAVAGRVVTRSGLPASRAGVGLEETWSGDGMLHTRERRLGTDLLGRFHVDGLPVGTTEVRAWRGQHAAQSGPIELRAGELSAGHELVLRSPSVASAEPLAALRGRVVDPAGVPVPLARITCLGESGRRCSRLTADDAGAFRLLWSMDEVEILKAYDPEGHWSEAVVRGLDLERRTEELVLVLGPPRKLRLYVTGRDGNPIERYGVEFVDLEFDGVDLEVARIEDRFLGRRLLPQRQATEGRSSVAIPDGEFLLRVEAPGFEECEIGPLHSATTQDPLRVELSPIAGIRGVVLAGGRPLPNADVRLRRVLGPGAHAEVEGEPCRFAPRAPHRGATDEEGSFVLHPPEAAVYVVQVRAQGYAMAESEELAVEPARGVRGIVLHMGRGGRIEGLVRVPAGWSRAGHAVVATRGDGEPRRMRTDERGRFVFSGLTSGPWSVRTTEQEGYRPEGVPSGNDGLRFGTILRWGESVEGPELDHNCTVLEGRTSFIELDLK